MQKLLALFLLLALGPAWAVPSKNGRFHCRVLTGMRLELREGSRRLWLLSGYQSVNEVLDNGTVMASRPAQGFSWELVSLDRRGDILGRKRCDFGSTMWIAGDNTRYYIWQKAENVLSELPLVARPGPRPLQQEWLNPAASPDALVARLGLPAPTLAESWLAQLPQPHSPLAPLSSQAARWAYARASLARAGDPLQRALLLALVPHAYWELRNAARMVDVDLQRQCMLRAAELGGLGRPGRSGSFEESCWAADSLLQSQKITPATSPLLGVLQKPSQAGVLEHLARLLAESRRRGQTLPHSFAFEVCVDLREDYRPEAEAVLLETLLHGQDELWSALQHLRGDHRPSLARELLRHYLKGQLSPATRQCLCEFARQALRLDLGDSPHAYLARLESQPVSDLETNRNLVRGSELKVTLAAWAGKLDSQSLLGHARMIGCHKGRARLVNERTLLSSDGKFLSFRGKVLREVGPGTVEMASGRLLITTDERVTLLEARGGKTLGQWERQPEELDTMMGGWLTLAEDGKRAIKAGALVDAATGRQLVSWGQGSAADWDWERERLLVWEDNQRLALRELETGRKIATLLEHRPKHMFDHGVAFLEAGRAFYCKDQTLKVFDLQGKFLGERPMGGELEHSSDGTALVLKKDRAELWDLSKLVKMGEFRGNWNSLQSTKTPGAYVLRGPEESHLLRSGQLTKIELGAVGWGREWEIQGNVMCQDGMGNTRVVALSYPVLQVQPHQQRLLVELWTGKILKGGRLEELTPEQHQQRREQWAALGGGDWTESPQSLPQPTRYWWRVGLAALAILLLAGGYRALR